MMPLVDTSRADFVRHFFLLDVFLGRLPRKFPRLRPIIRITRRSLAAVVCTDPFGGAASR